MPLLYQTIDSRLMSDPGPSILRLRVTPNSARSEVVGRHGDALRVRVASPPTNGRANSAVIEILADFLSIRPADIEIVRGHGSRDKVAHIYGIDSRALLGRLEDPAAATGSETS